MIQAAGLYASNMNEHAIGSIRNINTFNTYHYTVYVPTNDAIKKLIAENKIWTEDRIQAEQERLEALEDAMLDSEAARDNSDAAEAKYQADSTKYYQTLIDLAREERGATAEDPGVATDSIYTIAARVAFLGEQIEAFVKYHIQDNSVYYGAEFKIDTVHVGFEASYETAYMNKKNQFEKLKVRSNSNGIFVGDTQVTSTNDYQNKYNKVSINQYSATGAPLFNIMCREYEYNALDLSSVNQIETSSFVVIHQIDDALCNGVIKF